MYIRECTQRDSIREKDIMTREKHAKDEFIWTYTKEHDGIKYSKETFCPSMIDCFDELIINVVDQHQRMNSYKNPYRVNNLIVDYDGETISIFNDGDGIPHDKILDVITKTYTGINHDKNPKSTIGGTNGIGLKAVNHLSEYFTVESYDIDANILTSVEFKEGLPCNPLILSFPKLKERFGTKIYFRYDKTLLKCNDETKGKCFACLRQYISLRCRQVAFMYKNITVKYNNHTIEANINSLVGSMSTNMLHFESQDHNGNKIFISIGKKHSKLGQSLSTINGIFVSSRCEYTKCIKDKIKEYISLIGDGFGEIIAKNIFIVSMRVMAVECYSPDESQTKKRLKMKCPICKDIRFTPDFLDSIANYFSDLLLNKIKPKSRPKPANYIAAEYLGINSTLFPAEGNTAQTALLNIINHNNFKGDKRYFGSISVTGVPKNAKKKAIIQIRKGDRQSINFGKDKSGKVKDEFCLKGLIEIISCMNLQPHLTYDNDEDFKTLNYGKICACFDQDEDGIGNILSLIFSGIIHIWPNLYKRGILTRLNTPIIVCYNQTKHPTYFFTTQEFDRCSQKFDEVVYTKGLGSNSADSIGDIAKLCMITKYIPIDFDQDINTIDIYYGEDSKDILNRRERLTNVLPQEPDRQNISISDHFNYYLNKFYRYKILRQIPSYIDGLNISQRKIVAASRSLSSIKCTPLPTFAGRVKETMLYHHSESSLCKTITMLTQKYCGARTIALINSKSIGTGTISAKRTECDGYRYFNIQKDEMVDKYLFPKKDDRFLPINIVDGHKVEPKYYIPIIPLSLLEFYQTSGAGWMIQTVPRCLTEVLEAIKIKINNHLAFGINDHTINLSPETYPNLKCEVEVDGKHRVLYSVILKKDKQSITINALPPGMWTKDFCNELNDGGIYKAHDYTCNNNVHIEIIGTPESISDLKIYRIYNNNLNFCNEFDTVTMFSDYESIFIQWFYKRLDLYILRYEYLNKKAYLDHKMLLNKIRFIREVKIDPNCSQEVRHKLYADKDFDMLSNTINKNDLLLCDCKCFSKNLYGSLLNHENVLGLNNLCLICNMSMPKSIGSSYEYLDKMRVKHLSTEYLNILEEKIKTIKYPNPPHEMWLEELDAFGSYITS
jgi:DNA topoisomerase-2